MATTTLTTVNNLLKEVYEDRLRDQLQSEVVASKRIPSTSEGVTSNVGGKYVVFPIRTQRNHGIGARNELEALPVPQTQAYEAARVTLTYQYASMQITGQTLELASSNPQAFVTALNQEQEGLKQGLVKDNSRQLYGTAIGKLATANAAGSTTTFVCSDAEALYLEIGMIVDTYTSGDVIRNTASKITNISSTGGNTTVTFSPAATATASGDYMVRTGSRNREAHGFAEIVTNTGTLYNIDPTLVPVWTANIDSNGGTLRTLSEGIMIKMIDTIRKRGGSTTVIFCDLEVRRQYFTLLSQQRQYVNTQEFEGGFKGLAFTTDKGEVPVISDMDCQHNRMYFLNEKEFKIYQEGDWSFMNRDGSMWNRVVDSTGAYDAYNATMYKYFNLGTHRRNSHGLISDITE